MKKFTLFILSIFIICSFFSVARAVTLAPLTSQMGIGSKGTSVVALQNFLVNHGYLTGIVDGKFGPKTKAGVIKYQIANKISPTGFVGPLTFASINKIISGAIISNSNTSTTGATSTSTGTSSTTGTNSNTNTSTTQALSISTSSSLPAGQVGTDYNLDIEAMGGTAGYNNWEITSGSLPPGILLTVTPGAAFSLRTASIVLSLDFEPNFELSLAEVFCFIKFSRKEAN
jgi:peptidoglycan hydrolase-like protein with peptidoglycan-binding domain